MDRYSELDLQTVQFDGPEREALLLLRSAERYAYQEDVDAARREGFRALEMLKQLYDMDGAADCVLLLVHCFCCVNQHVEAISLATEELALQTAGTMAEAKIQLALGEISDEAAPELQQVMKMCEIFRAAGESRLQARALLVASRIHRRTSGAQALMLARQALRVSRSVKDRKGEAAALHCIACARQVSAESLSGLDVRAMRRSAKEAALEARDVYRELGMTRKVALELEWCARCHLQERNDAALVEAREAVELVGSTNDPLEARVLATYAEAAVAHGEPQVAVETVREALLRLPSTHTRLKEVMIAASVAVDDLTAAIHIASELLELHREHGDAPGEMRLQCTLAELNLKAGNSNEALDRAAAVLKARTDNESTRKAFRIVVDAAIAQGDGQRALHLARTEVSHWEGLGDRKEAALAMLVVASVFTAQRLLSKAAETASQAQRIFHDVKDRRNEAAAFGALGQVRVRQHHFERAARAYEHSEKLMCQVGDATGEASMMVCRAETHVQHMHWLLKSGKTFQDGDDVLLASRDHALHIAVDAASLARQLRWKRSLSNVLFRCAKVHIAVGSPDTQDMISESIEACSAVDDRENEATMLVLSAHVHLQHGSLELARTAAQRAMSLFHKSGNGKGERDSAQVLDRIAKASGGQSDIAGISGGTLSEHRDRLTRVETPMPDRELVRQVVGNAVRDLGLVVSDDEVVMQSGMTSASANIVRDALAAYYPDIHITPTLVYDYPTIEEMVQYICHRHADRR